MVSGCEAGMGQSRGIRSADPRSQGVNVRQGTLTLGGCTGGKVMVRPAGAMAQGISMVMWLSAYRSTRLFAPLRVMSNGRRFLEHGRIRLFIADGYSRNTCIVFVVLYRYCDDRNCRFCAGTGLCKAFVYIRYIWTTDPQRLVRRRGHQTASHDTNADT